jgi:hypothetical protein
MKGTTVAIALAPLAAAKQLVWPSKWDYVEDLQNNLGGYNKFGFMDGKSSHQQYIVDQRNTNNKQPLLAATSETAKMDNRTRPNGSEQLSTMLSLTIRPLVQEVSMAPFSGS